MSLSIYVQMHLNRNHYCEILFGDDICSRPKSLLSILFFFFEKQFVVYTSLLKNFLYDISNIFFGHIYDV